MDPVVNRLETLSLDTGRLGWWIHFYSEFTTRSFSSEHDTEPPCGAAPVLISLTPVARLRFNHAIISS